MTLESRTCECLEGKKCTNGTHKRRADSGERECGEAATMVAYTPDGKFGLLTCVFCSHTYAAKDWQVFVRGEPLYNPPRGLFPEKK